MSTRFTCLLGVLVLFAIGLLVACGSHYSASSDGLILVPSQGSAVIQTFSFNLSNGRVSAINNPPPSPGQPSSILLDPAGAFAYVIVTQNSAIANSKNGIATFKVNSNGTLSAIGTTPAANPVALALDSAGKFLFVANQSLPTTVCPQLSSTTATVQVFSIGSNASLTEVPGSPFGVPCAFGVSQATPSALAVTPTVFPSQHATCSTQVAPTTQYLYLADSTGNEVVEYSVDISVGTLTLMPYSLSQPGIPTGSVPSGVAVDPCNRFVYVTNQGSNNVSGYTICNGTSTSSPTCPQPVDGSLVPATGSPYNAANGPGPLAVDPLANFVYVVDTGSFQVSEYRISQVTGSLSPLTGSTIATGPSPVAIAIRSDEQWLFVTNSGSTSGNGSVSQFAITPATGTLAPAGAGITTDTFPSGVAVK